jgi:UDP-2,3-diacylglucosamine pyrophosphatase LpxH
MKRGLVISDLHLFSRRSDGCALWKDLEEKLAQTDILVLNGDTFDFRWSNLPTEEATIAAALAWIDQLISEFRGHRVHFIFGNHDCLIEFRRQFVSSFADRPNLVWHEYRLRLGRRLFLHGDCANRKMDKAALVRFRDAWSRDRPRGRFRKALYDGVDALGISHQLHEWYFPEGGTVRRVAYHLDEVMPGWRDEIDHCYFGHTHRPLADHSFEGVRFHNTGSGIRGMGFQPLTFMLGPDSGPEGD